MIYEVVVRVNCTSKHTKLNFLVYVETGATDGDTVSLAFLVTGTSNDQWNVKVSQIPCSASYRCQ